MISRENWLDMKEYVAHVKKIGRSPETVKKVEEVLRHLVRWADDTPFPRSREIDPAFPTYLITARVDGRPVPLGASTMKKACEYARLFFNFMRGEHLARYRAITGSWIETIRPSTGNSLQSEYHEHEFWEIDQVRKVAAIEPRNLTEERDRAALVFLFLSAMRARAFVSLPVDAVDLRQYKVSQFPRMGVRTKNSKAARTDMLRIPDLVAVVQAWDKKVREAKCRLWYPAIDRWHRGFLHDNELNWPSRTIVLNNGLRKLSARAGVPYLSAHKLRHGHAVYMMRRVKDMHGLKSLSQNLMHKSVSTTDGIYARLVRDDIADLYEGIEE